MCFKGNKDDMTTRSHSGSSATEEQVPAMICWTAVVFLCEMMNSSPGAAVSRKLCCAIAVGYTRGPAPPPRWLKVGDAFRRLRLLPPPSRCFSISHTGSNCLKEKQMLPSEESLSTFCLFSLRSDTDRAVWSPPPSHPASPTRSCSLSLSLSFCLTPLFLLSLFPFFFLLPRVVHSTSHLSLLFLLRCVVALPSHPAGFQYVFLFFSFSF